MAIFEIHCRSGKNVMLSPERLEVKNGSYINLSRAPHHYRVIFWEKGKEKIMYEKEERVCPECSLPLHYYLRYYEGMSQSLFTKKMRRLLFKFLKQNEKEASHAPVQMPVYLPLFEEN